MSDWTYVNGTIAVRGHKTVVKKAYKDIQGILTGSEGPCEIKLIHNDLHTGSHSRCRFIRKSFHWLAKICWRGYNKIAFVDEHDSWTFAFTGFLRDRLADSTAEEMKKLLEVLNSNDFLYVENIGVVITDCYTTKAFTNVGLLCKEGYEEPRVWCEDDSEEE